MHGSRVDGLNRLLEGELRALSPGLSLTTALATALAGYLASLGNRSLVIGVPVHHRAGPDSHSVIGPLVELFPCHIDVDPNLSLRELHQVVSRALMVTLQNAAPGSGPRQTFDVVLNVTTVRFGDFGDIQTTTRWMHSGHIDAHHRLRLQALNYDSSGPIEIALDINDAVASGDQQRRAALHFGRVLDAMIANLDRPVAELDVLEIEERQDLHRAAISGPANPLDALAPSALSESLRKRDHAPAVVHGDRSWSGGDLDDAISKVAKALGQLGIGRGDRVGVQLAIGFEALAVIHGIQRAGAAFVPIDPTYPSDRRRHIAVDSKAKLVIDNFADFLKEPRNSIPMNSSLNVLRHSENETDNVSESFPTVHADDEAYVIYTSGSTGTPKGVPITHRGLSEYLGFACHAYIDGDGTPPVMPLFTSLSFDLTITTLFLPLLSGGTITMHPEGGLPALRNIVDDSRVTLLKATPSHLELLVRMIDASHPLRTLIVGGEAFMTDLADRLLGVCGDELEIHNEYGPTEAVVGCMHHLYDPAQDFGPEVPIGVPAPGVELRIVNGDIAVPVGVAGELLIARPGLTTGYIDRSELNDERFIFGLRGTNSRRMYRTGDLVRLIENGTMVYLGRIDEQIKVGGIRLEPAEIEDAALRVDGVARAVAGLWQSDHSHSSVECVTCGLSSQVPGVVIDEDGVCSTCHQYNLVAPQAQSWFRTEDDLRDELALARQASTGNYDVIHLLSGGKDSTYALFSLVENGARVLSLTLDNGFISEGAKDNARRSTAALGVDHKFISVDGMNEIFRDSLDRYSNVCQGCYKTIYTVALKVAQENGVRAIVTGLSRGQFFETRLVPGMFAAGRFDPDEIDRAVDEARRVYHATPDAVSEQIDTSFLDSGELLESMRFIDFYRYVDVPLSEMIETLEASSTWRRPADTGRSTNCLINAAGIHVHQNEQGHHNYAEPYAWDVRLGHKTREEALEELDDPMGPDELRDITQMLADVGYSPKPSSVLTLWIEPEATVREQDIETLTEAINRALRDQLPSHALPTAIEFVASIPLSPNGKTDRAALPAPSARRLANADEGRPPEGETERAIAAIWSEVLRVDNISATDDFFAIGGASLAALETVVLLGERLNMQIPESAAFTERTIEDLALLIDTERASGSSTSNSELQATPCAIETRTGSTALSPGEEALLFEWRTDPLNQKYNVGRLYQVDGPIDVDRFNDALRKVVDHQPTLHTSYGLSRRTLSTDQALHTATTTSEEASLDQLADALHRQSFDLVNGPLVTVHHLQATNGSAILLRAHHIVCDAGSLDVLWQHVDRAYQDLPLPEVTLGYAQHMERHRANADDALATWKPSDEPAEFLLSHAMAGEDGYVHRSSPISAAELQNAAGTTAFASALGALTTALRSSYDNDGVDITITASLRDRPELAPVVGYFLNPVPVVVPTNNSASIAQVAVAASRAIADSMDRRSVQASDLAASSQQQSVRPASGQVMLAFEDLAQAEIDGFDATHRILSSGVAINDLTFFVQIRGQHLELGCEYRGSIGRQVATALLDSFADALEDLVRAPEILVRHATRQPEALVGDALLHNDVAMVPQKILDTINDTPHAIATMSSAASYSYEQLDQEARCLASRLRAVGVRSGDRIGIILPRSPAVPIAILASWYVGASYVPLSSEDTDNRLSASLNAAQVKAVILDDRPLAVEVPTVRTDLRVGALPPLPHVHQWSPEDEAYVIFTSGSSGAPKGVPISHGALAHSTAARRQLYGSSVERFLLVSNASFDSSVAGLFWTLTDGGTLVLPSESQVHDVDALLALIRDTQVTHSLMVPSLYQALLTRSQGNLDSLRTLIVAGEACPPALLAQHDEHVPNCELINEYGPTEATVWATAARHLSSAAATDVRPLTTPIGLPIPGVRTVVVDRERRHVPLGIPGELWISGPTLSSGYLGAPNEDDRFVVADDGLRYYRTGDRVVVSPGAGLQFLGRIDAQLSIGGVRIEPEEVEVALQGTKGIQGVAVDARLNRLVAWVEPMSIDTDPVDLRLAVDEAARAALPATHRPSVVEVVASLPRNLNGKLDRKRLHELASSEPKYAPELSTDDQADHGAMLALWCEAFDGEPLTAHSDFFEIGGDSLRAVVLVSLLEEHFGRRVGIGELIAAPTPALLQAHLEADTSLGSQHLTTTSTSTVSDSAASSMSPVPAEANPSAASLVEWLRRGKGDPLVVLPPGGGNLLRYQPLVAALPSELPIVGVRLPGADARSEIARTIEAQASEMLAALDEAGISPQQWRLIGWSTGGLLAWEIASRLHARGEAVEQVTLIDTVMPGFSVEPDRTIVQKYAELLADGGGRKALQEAWRRASERVDFAIARRRYRRDREAGRPPSILDAERELGPVVRKASAQYRPAQVALNVLYLAASESDDSVTNEPWQSFVEASAGSFELVTLQGVHFLPEEQCIIGQNGAPRAAAAIVRTPRFAPESGGPSVLSFRTKRS